MTEISVAITAHNSEKFLRTCLEELEVQTFLNFEVIVYDDCSTDRTRTILKECQNRMPRLQFILGDKLCGSPGAARNAILKSGKLSGKYVVFLDGDDRLEPHFLERLYLTAQRHSADITICSYDRFEDETGHVLCREMCGFPDVIFMPPKDDILAFINGALWNKLIRMDCVAGKQIPDFQAGEDLCFQLELYRNVKRIACVDEVLIHYRVHASSIISNTQEKTVYCFAEELARLHSAEDARWMRSTIAEIALIHIGVSMPLRVCDNRQVNMHKLLKWIYEYFKSEYNLFRKEDYLTLHRLLKHGVKGLGIWTAKICYRIHCFPLYLTLYKLLTNIFHIDIKF